MSNIRAIRELLHMTQAELAGVMGCTQGNVGHYERGQTVPPRAARRLLRFARGKGHEVGYEDVYGPVGGQEAASEDSHAESVGK
ncbi:MAG: helix-turn-helix domain-containing protein [Comamonadaceae bacterium]|nr:MAG: helix-turn-helix domain-containing protein [Comamonadaceae bacterium]